MSGLRLKGVVWDGGSLELAGGPQARPELDAMTRSGSVGGLGSFCLPVEGTESGGQAVIF